MTTLESRVSVVLGQGTELQTPPWRELIDLFRRDREAFYLLACDGVNAGAPKSVRELAVFAMRIHRIVRATYRIEQTAPDASVVTSGSGDTVVVPQHMAREVSRFLREIDGKETTTIPGKDYVGAEVSEAELRFKLGDRSEWATEQERLRSERAIEPFVLRVDRADIDHLAHQPAYVAFGLQNCARKTVLAPTGVYKGLKRGEGSCEDLVDGFAFCGKPRQSFDNQGNALAAPPGMVYLVFANKDRYVFDWDWVRENPSEPGHPIDVELRFEDPVTLGRDVVLDLPKDLKPGTFDRSKASYSERGDCIFCYISDEVAYAERINTDLTVFRHIGSDKLTGFKVKNVQRILQRDKSTVLDDAPDITVAVDSILLASLRLQQNASVEFYMVLIRALHKSVSEPPKVRLTRSAPQLAAT
jgi:hypothetical protein